MTIVQGWGRRLALLGLLGTLAACNSDGARKEEPVDRAPALSAEPQGPKYNLSEKLGEVDPDVPAEYTTTSTGLKYRILRKSNGQKPTAADTVLAHYRGWLDTNGRDFDSSYDRGEPSEFPLSGVVKGWTEGLQLIGKGGKIELIIPSNLGYGPQGSPPKIPPGATLHFVVELIDVH